MLFPLVFNINSKISNKDIRFAKNSKGEKNCRSVLSYLFETFICEDHYV